jgi:acyl-CoA reductase-like NAD-dependent aldehyde dehydrogenase
MSVGMSAEITALGPSGEFRSRAPLTLTDVAGVECARLSLAPPPFVTRAMAALRKARPLPLPERISALRKAGESFGSGRIGGLSVTKYRDVVHRLSGLGSSVIAAATEKLAERCASAWDDAQLARPAACASDWRDPRAAEGAAVWARRGAVLGVHAAGNHPGVHGNWLSALALGYRVAVRPSQREPVTAFRLVAALREAGFGADQVMLLPTDHAAADAVIRSSDRSVVYGGDDVVRRYARDPSVLVQGPGRAKILVTADVDWRRHVDLVVDSVVHSGGVSCTNTTAVFVEGDARGLAEAVAARLAEIPALPLSDERAVLQVCRPERARQLERLLLDRARGTESLLGGDGVVADLADGTSVLTPAVHLLPSAAAGQARVELPFPCVWIAPWSRRDGLSVFDDTLVLTVLGGDGSLVEELFAMPSVRNVYVGAVPTYRTAPHVPHDGFLADFLMEAKGVYNVA